MNEKSKAVEKWADVAMWAAKPHTDPQKPKVTLSSCVRDPLGLMAMVNGQYTGKVYNHPSETSDEERREAWHAATVSLLSEAPLEWVQMSFSLENIPRSITHQLVRTRQAGYAQESLRFAVKEGVADATKLPPSLGGTMPKHEWIASLDGLDPSQNLSDAQSQRNMWEGALHEIENIYESLIESGMPAEDARGLLPTNILTRIHMHVDMGTLLKLAGKRLCTQAQFEWREIIAQVVQALREYGYAHEPENAWQYELMAERFRPVCFSTGHCPVNASADRHCAIRGQVDEFARHGVPSKFWEQKEPESYAMITEGAVIPFIRPDQWLADPAAARVRP